MKEVLHAVWFMRRENRVVQFSHHVSLVKRLDAMQSDLTLEVVLQPSDELVDGGTLRNLFDAGSLRRNPLAEGSSFSAMGCRITRHRTEHLGLPRIPAMITFFFGGLHLGVTLVPLVYNGPLELGVVRGLIDFEVMFILEQPTCGICARESGKVDPSDALGVSALADFRCVVVCLG